jgi:hypothetical protein
VDVAQEGIGACAHFERACRSRYLQKRPVGRGDYFAFFCFC